MNFIQINIATRVIFNKVFYFSPQPSSNLTSFKQGSDLNYDFNQMTFFVNHRLKNKLH